MYDDRLGFKGCKYTWTNKRYRNRQKLIFEKVDRYVANDSLIKLLRSYVETHLARTKYDHYPMLITFDSKSPKKGTKPFTMEPMWCGNPSFQSLVKNWFNNQDTLKWAITLFSEEGHHLE